jgi:uncharacterized membrane protein
VPILIGKKIHIRQKEAGFLGCWKNYMEWSICVFNKLTYNKRGLQMIFILWALLCITSIGSIYGIAVANSTSELIASIIFLVLSMIGLFASIHYYMKRRDRRNRSSGGWDCLYCDIPFPMSSGKSSGMDCTDCDCNPFN